MKRPRILFLTEGKKSPSTRFAVSSFLPYLEKKGIYCSVSHRIPEKYALIHLPLINYRICRILVYSLFAYPLSVILRLMTLFTIRRYDIVFLQRDLDENHTSAWLEGCLRRYARSFLFYFDDALWLYRNHLGKSIGPKIEEIIRMSDWVIVSHQFLADYAHRFNKSVMILPMSIDTGFYTMKSDMSRHSPENNMQSQNNLDSCSAASEKSRTHGHQNKKTLTLGWSGGPWNYPDLMTLVNILGRIKRETDVEILIQSGEPPPSELQEIGIVYVKWQKETEVKVLQRMDIALCPLRDSPWARGKFSIKLLQYMACGIPVICSDVGINPEIIINGQVGFAVKTEDEWRSKILILIRDSEIREKMGRAARQRAIDEYSLEKNSAGLADFFISLAGANRASEY